MKKKLVMVMISTMLVASLMACGSKKNESGKANTKTEQSANNTDTKDAKKTEEKELSYDTIKDYPETKASDFQTEGTTDYPDDTTVTAACTYSGKDKVVVVPSEIDGKKVVEIGKLTFGHNKYVEGIVIPDTVERISDSAFIGCKNLKYVVLSKNLKAIEEGTFINTGIKEITFPATLSDIGENGASLNGLIGVTINVEPGMSDNIMSQLEKWKNALHLTIVQK
jgi:uncharacterized lipoprotein YehR (DUF1307 family)